MLNLTMLSVAGPLLLFVVGAINFMAAADVVFVVATAVVSVSFQSFALFKPTLIDKGLGSDVSDVRAAALVVVMKISRSAGELLKPHLGVLIPALLVSYNTSAKIST
jgi:hypothetical protein